MSRHAVLQSVSTWKRCDCEKDSGYDRTSGKSHSKTGTGSSCTQEARQLGDMRQYMHPGRAEPHDETRLVQSDNSPLCLAEDE